MSGLVSLVIMEACYIVILNEAFSISAHPKGALLRVVPKKLQILGCKFHGRAIAEVTDFKSEKLN